MEAIVSVHDHIFHTGTCPRVILALLVLNKNELALTKVAIDLLQLIKQLREHRRFDLVLYIPLGLGLQKMFRDSLVALQEVGSQARIAAISPESDLGESLGVEVRLDTLKGGTISK